MSENKFFKIKKEIRQGDVFLPVQTMVVYVEKRAGNFVFKTKFDQEVSIAECDVDCYFEENKNLFDIFKLFIS